MTVGIRHDDLRRRNRAMLLAAIRRNGQLSRTDLARMTGLSHSTISAISSDLIGEGALCEVPAAEGAAARRGRPQIALGFDPRAAGVVSVSLSLNDLSLEFADYAGHVRARHSARPATHKLTAAGLIDAVRTGVRAVTAKVGRDAPPLRRITMAVQGITDSPARRLVWSPITPHDDIAFADALEEGFGVPATIENDCNMIAVALRAREAHRDSDNFIALLLSNGIGMGLVLRGGLFTGAHSSGGEFGHMVHVPGGALCRCGRHGCIEAYAGNYAIYRHALGLDELATPAEDIDEETMTRLAQAARASDGTERRAFEKAAEAIGTGLGSLFALIDAAPVAVVGRGTAAFDLLEPVMRKAIAATAGGQHAAAITFEVERDERPIIHEGCVRTALAIVDADIVAPGPAGAAATAQASRMA
jgi:predicted NBD/HSP70 family sugar kinase